MESAIIVYEDIPIRKLERGGETWISAIDVARALEYTNPSVAVSTIIERNKERFKQYVLHADYQIDSQKTRKRKMVYLNAKGVIAFCMLSRQKKAIPFQRWADTVLAYNMAHVPEDIRIMARRRRIVFTDTLKEHGYKKPVEYATTTKKMKAALGINENKPKKDCDLIEVAKIASAEMVARAKVMADNVYGYKDVHNVCIQASNIVGEFVDKKCLTK